MKTLSPSEPSPPKGRSSLCSASQRHVKPELSPPWGMSSLSSRLPGACQACALASLGHVRPVLSPPKGRSSLCSRLSEACQACALASQRHVKPVLSPPKGMSNLCSRLASPKGANVHNRRLRSLRSLHQRLWIFAAFGDACLSSSRGMLV